MCKSVRIRRSQTSHRQHRSTASLERCLERSQQILQTNLKYDFNLFHKPFESLASLPNRANLERSSRTINCPIPLPVDMKLEIIVLGAVLYGPCSALPINQGNISGLVEGLSDTVKDPKAHGKDGEYMRWSYTRRSRQLPLKTCVFFFLSMLTTC